MIALLLAAALSGQQPSALPTSRVVLGDAPTVMRARACGFWQAKPVSRTASAPKVQRLGDLPPANLEIAVLRLDANGCSLPVIVRYDVQGDGRVSGK